MQQAHASVLAALKHCLCGVWTVHIDDLAKRISLSPLMPKTLCFLFCSSFGSLEVDTGWYGMGQQACTAARCLHLCQHAIP